ncbi:hypothetical protein Taro_044644 [Colocasia esculenta]|uniref:Uncharacterized protein n=1 Tax=Colocasia esculenta TaxID=4460 RepID=A0A843WMF1_COLES|nr:hypothetical protein [Colocasia esculenta]
MPTVVTSPVGCPRFFVSQAFSSGLCPGTCVVPSRFVSSDLDTLTLVFELHVRLRERRHALVVGGTDTSRRTGPQLVLFQCLTLESSGPGSLEVSGMGLRPCGPQVVSADVVPRGMPQALASASSREADSGQVRYRFNGLGRGIPSQAYPENLQSTTLNSLRYKSSQHSLSLLLTTHSAAATSTTRPTPSSRDDEPLAEGSSGVSLVNKAQ